jgi:hypothetical protein
VTRRWICAEAVSASFGRPLGRLGFGSSMHELSHTQIILDKPFLA